MSHISPQNRLLIAGTGAMASLFAARLTAANIQVVILGNWSAALDAIEKDGIRLIETDGSEKRFSVNILNRLSGCESFKFAIVLVKSWQTRRTAQQLQQCLATDGVALTLQNGLGNREILCETLGENRVALGVTTTGASLQAPGVVRAGGSGVILLEKCPSVSVLADILLKAGFQVQFIDNSDSLVWRKLIVNAAINPVTALLDIQNGDLLENETAFEIVNETAREATAVAQALGISLSYLDMVNTVEEVIRRTATNRSSMLQDLTRGAPTEINAINGAIVRIGEELGVQSPVNWTLWKLVQAAVNKKRRQ